MCVRIFWAEVSCMNSITLDLPEALELALVAHCKRTGDSFDHVILRALADFLDLEHHTIYQVSTSGALVEGIYRASR
jgi:acetolactate decarboxylase